MYDTYVRTNGITKPPNRKKNHGTNEVMCSRYDNTNERTKKNEPTNKDRETNEIAYEHTNEYGSNKRPTIRAQGREKQQQQQRRRWHGWRRHWLMRLARQRGRPAEGKSRRVPETIPRRRKCFRRTYDSPRTACAFRETKTHPHVLTTQITRSQQIIMSGGGERENGPAAPPDTHAFSCPSETKQ